MFQIDPERWRALLLNDGEFLRAARGWSGSFAFADGNDHRAVVLEYGQVTAICSGGGASEAAVTFTGPTDGWRRVFADAPTPYYQDLLGGAVGRQGFTVSGDLGVMAAYYGAIARAARLAGVAHRERVS